MDNIKIKQFRVDFNMVLIGLLGLLLMAIHLPIVDKHDISSNTMSFFINNFLPDINLQWYQKQALYVLDKEYSVPPLRGKKPNYIIIDDIEDDSELHGKNL